MISILLETLGFLALLGTPETAFANEDQVNTNIIEWIDGIQNPEDSSFQIHSKYRLNSHYLCMGFSIIKSNAITKDEAVPKRDINEKSICLATRLSLFFPGVGHFYVGTTESIFMGAFHAFGDIATIAFAIYSIESDISIEAKIIEVLGAIFGNIINRILCMLSAKKETIKYNKKHVSHINRFTPVFSVSYLKESNALAASLSCRF